MTEIVFVLVSKSKVADRKPFGRKRFKSFDSLFFTYDTHFMLNSLFLLCNIFQWFKSAVVWIFVIIYQQSHYHYVIVNLFFISERITRNVCKWRSRDIDTYVGWIWRFVSFFTFIFLKRKRNIEPVQTPKDKYAVFDRRVCCDTGLR